VKGRDPMDRATMVPVLGRDSGAVRVPADYRMLGQFVAESGKIVPRRLTGVCTPHQRRLSTAIKQARNIALLPFAGASR
jgi:ribosomal protein S18